MVSHKNIVFNVKTILPLIPISAGMRSFEFFAPLPRFRTRRLLCLYVRRDINVFFDA
jgi:hypothetical protein